MNPSARLSSTFSARHARVAAGALAVVLLGAGLSACSSGDDTASSFCDSYKSLSLDSSLSGLDSSDPAATVKQVEAINTKIKDIKAPEEIASDWQSIQTFFADYSKLFDGVDLTDDAAVQTAMGKVSTLGDEVSGMTTAGTNVDAYAKKNCK